MSWSVKESDIVGRAHDAEKLLNFEIDELYAILGCQVLALASPSRAAGVMAQISELKKHEMHKGTNLLATALPTTNGLRRLKTFVMA